MQKISKIRVAMKIYLTTKNGVFRYDDGDELIIGKDITDDKAQKLLSSGEATEGERDIDEDTE